MNMSDPLRHQLGFTKKKQSRSGTTFLKMFKIRAEGVKLRRL